MSGAVFHAPFLHAHPGFNLHGVVERSTKKVNERYPDVRSYDSIDELLSDASIDLVIVNTPNNTHYTYAKAALSAGKHVVVEKPFTVHSQEARELIELSKQMNRKLAVYHNRRYDSDFKTVRSVLESGALGEVREAEIHFDRYKLDLSVKAHKETGEPGTGVLYDLGSHIIDQALVLFGMPDSIFADLAAFRPQSKADDYFELLLFYADKRVRLKASYVAKHPVPSYVIHGTEGSFLKSRADIQEAMLQQGEEPKAFYEPESEAGILDTIDGVRTIETLPGNYMEFYERVFEGIVNDTEMPVSGDDGLKVIRMIKAAFESARLQKVIAV
jgi:predicted dehydrogenase